MQELDQWTDATVVKPLVQGVYDDVNSKDQGFWLEIVGGVKKAIREKVLESYRNGQAVGPRKSLSHSNSLTVRAVGNVEPHSP